MKKDQLVIIAAAVLVLAAGAVYATSHSRSLESDLRATEKELQERTTELRAEIENLEQKLAEAEADNEGARELLTQEQRRRLDLEREQRRNEREIDELTKLTTIDPELLKKYSKVYFLSENYTPPELAEIEEQYRLDPDKDLQIMDDIEPFLHDMLDEAQEDGVDLRVASAYRSFDDQGQLKAGYVVQYGTGANAFSAEQGYSEHQLGTTVDLTTPQLQSLSLAFESTEAFAWLQKNAHNYGFVLSYPKGNQFYVYEPWHWRFVGEELADDLYFDDQNFYDLDQREIDEYLITIFD